MHNEVEMVELNSSPLLSSFPARLISGMDRYSDLAERIHSPMFATTFVRCILNSYCVNNYSEHQVTA